MMKRNLRSGRLVNLAIFNYKKANKEADEEDVEEDQRSHSFLNKEYPDPESDFSDNGSSDNYVPSLEEDEVSSSVSEVSIEDIIPSATQHGTKSTQSSYETSTITTCAPSTQPGFYSISSFIEDHSSKKWLTTSTVKNTVHYAQSDKEIKPQSHIMPHPKAQLEPYKQHAMPDTNTQPEPDHQHLYDNSYTDSQPEPKKQLTYVIPHTGTQPESDQQHSYIMSHTDTLPEPKKPLTYVMPHTGTQPESDQQYSYIMSRTYTLPEPKKQLTYVMPHTGTQPESDQQHSYVTPHTNSQPESDQQHSYVTPHTNSQPESDLQHSYVTPHTNSLPESDQQHSYVTPHTNSQPKSNQPQEVPPSHGTDCNNSIEKGRNKDFCFYCELQVLNFARHIIRNHFLEVDVQKILAYPKKSETRRKLINDLKKKGNYISNVVSCERPMRVEKGKTKYDYLPCPSCLGFYARKQLWKHKKKCNPELQGKNSQADAQNLICRNSSHKPSKSLEKVFARMRADKISFIAKQDPIICQFGENYMKIHREDHFIPVTSRKMRELAKLLIEVQKNYSKIGSFFEALKPQNYDVLVEATKRVAKFDETTGRYFSPTYAMNISTSIKQCCNIAIKRILKTEPSTKTAEMQADLRTLVQLIESTWKFDVSSNAADDLNLKKWNKVTIVPLASDLKLLKDHLCSVAQRATSHLQDSDTLNTTAYNELEETVFCRTLLLNRRRPGELQRLLLSTYVENEQKDNQYEEFDRTLSATEKILVQRFKRIVIRGKRSRGVPVLFSIDVQQDLELLISLRNKYIDADNKFLFARPSGMTTLCGYKILQKHVKLCGAKNPEAISSTKLRKHLATLTQLFNMTENDIEQLSNFMGHTTGVHRRNYRLPDDIFQTAKISKLLILMEDGKADAYKGKSLDEININMEENLEGEELAREEIIAETESQTAMATDMPENLPLDFKTGGDENVASTCEPLADISNIRLENTKKKRVLVPWTTEQKNVVITHFKRHIKAKKAPKRHECDDLKALYPGLLDNKDWLKIKVFIQNYYSKK